MLSNKILIAVFISTMTVALSVSTIILYLNNLKLNEQIKKRDMLIENQIEDFKKFDDMKNSNDSILSRYISDCNIIIDDRKISPIDLLKLLQFQMESNIQKNNTIINNAEIAIKTEFLEKRGVIDTIDYLVLNPPFGNSKSADGAFEMEKIKQVMERYPGMYITCGYDKNTGGYLITNDVNKVDLIWDFYFERYKEDSTFSLKLYPKDFKDKNGKDRLRKI